MITWCVAHTQALKESIAQQNLLAQGFEVYLPKFKKTRRHARKVDEVLAPLFPRYIFVGMDLETALWRGVNGARGVSKLLMFNETCPATVPLTVIEELKAQEDAAGVLPIGSIITFAKGDKVRILDGAFQDQIAVFAALDDVSRVQLLLNFLGREMKISMPVYAVERLG